MIGPIALKYDAHLNSIVFVCHFIFISFFLCMFDHLVLLNDVYSLLNDKKQHDIVLTLFCYINKYKCL